MPKLWEDTIETHRQAVRDAVLEAAWGLVRERGLTAVTTSETAVRRVSGRATTLYKYFPDVEAILRASHDQHVADPASMAPGISAMTRLSTRESRRKDCADRRRS